MAAAQLPGTTHGVTFNVSLSPASALPGFDPTGANLVDIIDAAGDYWSNIFLDPFTFNIQVGYGTGGGNQAFACYDDGGGMCVDGEVLPALPSDAFIEFNSLQGGGSFAPYFFDSTPNNHSEFTLSQTLFRDLSPGNQSFFYDVTPPPPDLFETGYQGGADVGGPADNRVDAYSIALHEIGHLLGMINEIAQPESSDDHFDIDPDFVAGNIVRVRTLSNDNEHLNDTVALMQSTLGADVRALPSATDVLSIVAGSNPKWTIIDLPRKEFLSGTVWDLSGNWLGNRLPDGEDDVFIRHGGEVSVLVDQEAGNLTIAEATDVTLSTSELTVNDTLRVEGAGGGTATFTVPAGSLLDAATVRVGDDGQFGTDGSIFDVAVTANSFIIEPGGVAIGSGRISANSISNSGSVVAFAGFGTTDVLALDATGGGTINLDGNGSGQLFAVLGSLLVSGPLSDSFDGEITVGQGRTIFFDEPWTFAPDLGGTAGTINLNGGESDAALATINTDTWSANNGQINVAGKANVVGTATLGTNLSIDVAAGGTLDLDGVTTFQGGTYTGLGTIVLNNNMVVASSTTADVSRFDLDGDSFGQTLTLNAPLELNVDFIDTGNNVFNADEIDVNFNGRLAVNLNNPNASWRMAGTLNINLGLFPQTVLTGSPVEITGTVNADGASFLAAPLDISGQVNLADAQTRVMLSGPSSLRRTQDIIRSDATLSGLGVLEITSSAALDLEDGAAVGVVVENDGLLTVAGDAPGIAGLGSDYRQTNGGVLISTIAGPMVGDDHDQLDVAGVADLAGELRAVIADGFAPNNGDQFTVLDAIALLDEFDTVSVLDEADVLGYESTVLYSPPGESGNVVIQIDASFLIGDYNENGAVDAADFTVWRDLLGAPAGSLPNDIDGGIIGQAQYSTWKSHFGNTLPTPASIQQLSVPEPACWLLTFFATIGECLRRRPAARKSQQLISA